MMMATLMVVATPASLFAQAEEAEQPQVVEEQPTGTRSTTQASVTVNGKTFSTRQKAVARQMARQGARMAAQGARMAARAAANPLEAERIAEEMESQMEAMGNEMERLGDSLEAMSEDTTFLYDEADADSIEIAGDDGDVFLSSLEEDFGWLHTWWGKIIGGSLGILAGILGILIALFVVVLLIGIFTAPIWILALIIWLAVRGGRKNRTQTYQNPPLNPTPGTPNDAAPNAAAATAARAQAASAQAASAQTATAQPAAAFAQPGVQNPQSPQPAVLNNYAQPYPDENTEIWKSGIMYSCIGVGLIILFYSIGLEGLWGVGALVACIGVAKLVIATTSKKKQQPQQPTQPDPTSDDYSKSEN